MGAATRRSQTTVWLVPLLVRRSGEQRDPTMPGLRGEAAAREPAVTRADLIAELAASSPQLRRADAELIVATIFDQITAALARGERVELRGFGAFTVKPRSARIGRNPRTQETVQVDEKMVPLFKAGREMLRRLNGGSRPASAHPT
jgi:integration host factor subunit beta